RRSVGRNHQDLVVLVELDIDRAHLAFGVVNLIDALLLLLDLFVSRATEFGEDRFDLLDLCGGKLVIVVLPGIGGGAGQPQGEGQSGGFEHVNSFGFVCEPASRRHVSVPRPTRNVWSQVQDEQAYRGSSSWKTLAITPGKLGNVLGHALALGLLALVRIEGALSQAARC